MRSPLPSRARPTPVAGSLAWLVLLVVLLLACGTSPVPPDASTTGSVIVGVRSQLRAGVDLDRLRVTMLVDGKPYREDDLTSAKTTLSFPTELGFSNLPGGSGVSVLLEGTLAAVPGVTLVSRLASTKVVPGATRLLEVTLESACLAQPPGSPGGAPTCAAPQTCIHGACASSAVDPAKLPAYAASWSHASDICKPANAGAPVVVVGEGQSDYLPLTDNQVAQVEAGPQGGHHIWIAIRMKNLRQSGTITSVTGFFPDLGVTISPFNVIFTYDQDEGGYCKLYGLRFQLDQVESIDKLLGHTIDVTVTATDADQTVGVGKKTVTLSKTFI